MGWFSRRRNENEGRNLLDLTLIGVDMHSHIIPLLDDGSQSLEDSLTMVQGLADLGYRKLFLTPHIKVDFFPNTKEKIQEKFSLLKNAVVERGLSMELEFAAEYFLDFTTKNLIEKHEVLTFGENYFLFELSYFTPPQFADELIFLMQTNGYKPILAHPERYVYMHKDFESYQKLKDKEVLFQLNINSLSGLYSPQVKKVAEKLIQAGMVEFVGTDAHNVEHITAIRSAMNNSSLINLIESGSLLNNSL